MSLSETKANESYNALIEDANLTEVDRELIRFINEVAAQDNILLHAQSPRVVQMLKSNVQALRNSEESREALGWQVYSQLCDLIQGETKINQQAYIAQGFYDSRALHLRNLTVELQDNDLNSFMPQSTECVEILAPIIVGNAQLSEIIKCGIEDALSKPAIQHIMIPVGPHHWRCLYLSKPAEQERKYQLEIFDSQGAGNAVRIYEFVLNLLRQCGLVEDKLQINCTGPKHLQKDSYSCGDYVCAHSHKKLKELGSKGYNQRLIDVLEASGNHQHALRHATREFSVDKDLDRQLALTAEERRVVEATTSAYPVDGGFEKFCNYKQEVAALVKSRHSIFAQARVVGEKTARNEVITDEDLATQLQAEELGIVGL